LIATLPTGVRGRLLALGFLIVALGALYVLVALPLLDLYAERTALVQSQEASLRRLNVVAGEVPALRARVAAFRAGSGTDRPSLEGASDAIASAALQGRIAELAAAAGVTIGSSEGLPPSGEGAYHRLGLALSLSGSYDSLLELLARFEAVRPPLIIDKLELQTYQRRRGDAVVSALNASIEVYGFRAGDAGGAAEK
jgi:hypothetical protein